MTAIARWNGALARSYVCSAITFIILAKFEVQATTCGRYRSQHMTQLHRGKAKKPTSRPPALLPKVRHFLSEEGRDKRI